MSTYNYRRSRASNTCVRAARGTPFDPVAASSNVGALFPAIDGVEPGILADLLAAAMGALLAGKSAPVAAAQQSAV